MLGAALAVLLAGLVAIPGCLNPRPEEDPSALELADPGESTAVADDDNAPEPVDPTRETCDDNPFLAECELPSPAPGQGNVDAPPASEQDPSADPADAGAPANDAGGVDAGAAAASGSPLAE